MKSFKYLSAALLAAMAICLCSCGGDDPVKPDEPDKPEGKKETVSLPVVSDIQAKSARVSASTTAEASAVKQKGFVWSTTPDPSISSDRVQCAADFSAELTGLKSGTEYYLKAYVMTAGSGTVYSDQVTFTTQKSADPTDFVAPAYPDNYASLSDWSKRSQWNLANVHDPTVCLAEDGYYYMYQTDASYGNAHAAGGHFHCRRSKNLVDWEYLGGTMKSLPAWVPEKLDEIRKDMGLPASTAKASDYGYWAPCVRKVRNGLYRMYYSIVVPGSIDAAKTSWSERAFIGMMETSDPSDNDSWVDKGYVITNASDKGLDFHVNPSAWESCYFRWNAIDPSYIITPEGEHWLVYGSWHSGLVAVKLDPETGKPAEALPAPWGTADDVAPYGKRIYTRLKTSRWQASEGPEIIYNNGWYYLFMAYDALEVPYNTRVVRSRNVDGPYVDMFGTEVSTAGGDAYPIVTHPYKFSDGYGWVGISHCAVFDDGAGHWYFSSQGRFPVNVGGNAYSNALMMGQIRRIVWCPSSAEAPDDLWPVVLPERYAGVPDYGALTSDDLVGTWEHIDLKYNYGKQDTSAKLVLSPDGTLGGAMNGKWKYDAATGRLTLGDSVVCVEREVDWEASPRRVTIVYSGIDKARRCSLWGKKVD